MPQYTYSRLQDDLIYNLTISPKSPYLDSLYSPLKDLITYRHNSNPDLSNLLTLDRRDYNGYLNWTNQSSMYPSLHSINFNVLHSSTYLDELSNYYNAKSTTKKFSFDTVFPIAVRYTDNKNIWLIERPPFLANVTFKNARSSSHNLEQKQYSFWMPWTVMLLMMVPEQSHYEASLFFNDGPLTSLEESAIPCFFPNMYGDARMCLNQTSILLQQHLSQVNSFDPATVYNFIINDYMTGGWNTDLGVQVFDNMTSISQTASKARRTMLVGDPANKKKYPSGTTPSGRTSQRKYLPNFLNYFSHSSLEEITSIVSEVKEKSSARYNTYEKMIDRYTSQAASFQTYTTPFVGNNTSYSINISQDLYIDPAVDKLLLTCQNNAEPESFSYEESMCESIFNFLRSHFSSNISSLLQDSTYNFYDISSPNLYLDTIEDSHHVYLLDPKVQDQNFLDLKFPISTSEVSNV